MVAHERYNSRNWDFLAAQEHPSRCSDRFEEERPVAPELEEAKDTQQETAPERSLSVTRGIYL